MTVTGSGAPARAAIGACGQGAKSAYWNWVLDPFIIVPHDADPSWRCKNAAAGRYQNTGQVCAAAKRFIVEEALRRRLPIACGGCRSIKDG